MSIKIRIKKQMPWLVIVFILYFMIAYLTLKSGFSHLMQDNLKFGDGIYYAILDVVLMVAVLRWIGLFQNDKTLLFAVILTLYHLLLILVSGRSNVMVTLLREVTWLEVLLGTYFFLTIHWKERERTVCFYTTCLIVLSVFVVINEIQLRREYFESGINLIYWIELGLPVVFLVNNRFVRGLTCVILCLAVLLSLKSTAIIAIIIPLIVAIALQKAMNGNATYKGIITISVLVVLIYLIAPYMLELINKEFGVDWGLKFQSSVSSGGSGRMEIWSRVFSLQLSSNAFEWLFGHGYNAVIRAIGKFSAHNDFLEILFDYGLIGFSAYVSLIVELIKRGLYLLKRKKQEGIVLITSMIQFLILSTFSHLFIYPGLMIVPGFIWALCLSAKNLRKEVKNA